MPPFSAREADGGVPEFRAPARPRHRATGASPTRPFGCVPPLRGTVKVTDSMLRLTDLHETGRGA